MPSFKDNKGREWNLSLDGPTIHRVRAESCGIEGCRHRPLRDKKCEGIDPATLNDDVLRQLDGDHCMFVDMLWLLCKEQAVAANVSDVEFGRAIVGDIFPLAKKAFSEARYDFFQPSEREMAKNWDAMATKEATLQQAAITKALAKLDDPRLEKALDAQIEAEMRKLIPSNSVTDGPGPSASDPTD